VAWYRRLLLLIAALRRVVTIPNMRLPHVLFSVRCLMIATALAGISLGLIGRRSRALTLAEHHRSAIVSEGWACSRSSSFRFYTDGQGRPATAEQFKKSEWHRKLYSKYRLATNYPWLPIEPDPPEPE